MSTQATYHPTLSPAANAPQAMWLLWVNSGPETPVSGKIEFNGRLSTAIDKMQRLALQDTFCMGRVVDAQGVLLADITRAGKVIH